MGLVLDCLSHIQLATKRSYLELGYGTGDTFKNIHTLQNKFSVDIDKIEANFIGTTNDFFAQNNNKYDIVYIDACHEYSQVVKDFNNSVDVLVEYEDAVIFMHDMFPDNEWQTSLNESGDAYKILLYFLENDYEFYFSRYDCGATMIFNPKKIDKPVPQKTYQDLLKADFQQHLLSRQELINYFINRCDYIVYDK
jgi:hypothetical protein